MSQTAIPLEFEKYLQNQISIGKAPDMNEMIFAFIPGLDPSKPIDRTKGLPDPAQWVHQQNIDQVGKMGDNALAYSVVIPGSVKAFTFNAIYIRDKNVPNSCGMVVHKVQETKEDGMAATKSLVQAYDGAAKLAGITVDASTWQIDYQARLKGIDNDHRLSCEDYYGHHAFVSGFDVTQQADPNKYKITTGVLYAGGLRGVLANEVLQTITAKPNGLYVDVVRKGTPLSAFENIVTIRLSPTELVDYVDANGDKHYIAKLAGINADGSVTDWRVKGGLEQHVNAADPHKQYLMVDDMVGFIMPDSTVAPLRKYAFKGDGAKYNVADYPKLMSKVKGTAAMVAQSLIDAEPEKYAARFGISADGLEFSVPNYTLRPHLAVAGGFGAVGTTKQDHIQNITGKLTNTSGEGMTFSAPSQTVQDGALGVSGEITYKLSGTESNAVSKLLLFDASKSARTSTYTEVNTSFLNFYIIHGEAA